MLDDRSYMRREYRPHAYSASVILIAINVAVFLAELALGDGFFVRHFALSPRGLFSGAVWQLLTFQFLHGGLFHILANCLVIYFFGRALEEVLGVGRFLKLYFIAGTVGGLVHIGYSLISGTNFPVLGASAGAAGLVAAFAMLFPDRILTLLIFFVIPVSLRARTLLWISLALAIVGLVLANDNIAHAAHLGGILAGVAYARWGITSGGIPGIFQRFRPAPRQDPVATATTTRPGWIRPGGPDDPLPSGEFISREVDPILDKISAQGIQSLTDEERRILDAARRKMARR